MVVRLSELATEVVELEDDEGGEAVAEVAYTHPCRCGEVYEVLGSEIAMETSGLELECTSCCLKSYFDLRDTKTRRERFSR